MRYENREENEEMEKKLILQSSLSMEEIQANFKDIDFFTELILSLSEAISYAKGKPCARTVVHRYVDTDQEKYNEKEER